MKRLRPFFLYFGAKWRIAPRYPEPRHDTIIEPFAGAAGYAMLHHDQKHVILVDKNPIITGIWAYLIRVSPREILSLPLLREGDTIDDLGAVSQEAKWLVGFWLNSATTAPSKTPCKWMVQYQNEGKQFSFWSEQTRATIAAQVEHIRHWRVIAGDYTAAPNIEATWFIDPPYASFSKLYRQGPIDYATLVEFCRTRLGQTVVCEAGDAAWLPFKPFATVAGSIVKHRAGKSNELIWQNNTTGENMENVNGHDDHEADNLALIEATYLDDAKEVETDRLRTNGPYVSRVRSNIKGATFDTVLGPRTLIVGPNAEGKSSRVNAVEFALTKSVSDVAGRESVKLPAELLSLGDGASTWASVDVTLPSGKVTSLGAKVERKDSAAGSGASKVTTEWPSGWNPANVLPVQQIRTALLGSPETARAFFLGAIGGSAPVDLVQTDEVGTKPHLLALAMELNAAAGPIAPEGHAALVHNLSALSASAKQAARAASVKIEGLTVAVNALAGNHSAPSDAEIDAAEVRVADAASAVEAIVRAQAEALSASQRQAARPAGPPLNALGVSFASQEAAGEGHTHAVTTLMELEGYILGAEQAIVADPSIANPFPPDVEETVNQANYLLRIMGRMKRKGVNKCVCCGTGLGSTEAAAALFTAREEAIRTQMGALIAKEETKREYNKQLGEVKAKHAQWTAYKAECERWIEWFATRAKVVDNDVAVEPAVPSGFDLQRARVTAQAARDDLTRLRGIASRLLDVGTQRAEIAAQETRMAAARELHDAVEAIAKRRMDAGIEAFEKRVQRHLTPMGGPVEDGAPGERHWIHPERNLFKLVTTGSGGQETFRVGLVWGDDPPRTALSGAEWVRVTLAVTAAVTEGDKGKLRVIIPEERAFDSGTLGEVMRAMENAPGQVILTSPVEPPEEACHGWTIVRLAPGGVVRDTHAREAKPTTIGTTKRPRKGAGLSDGAKGFLNAFGGITLLKKRIKGDAAMPDIMRARVAFMEPGLWPGIRTELAASWPDLETALPPG